MTNLVEHSGPQVILVSNFEANPVGHGGNHRSYQILADLEQAVGAQNVLAIRWPPPAGASPGAEGEGLAAAPRSLRQTVRGVGRSIPPLRAAARAWRGSRLLASILEARGRGRYLLQFVRRQGGLLGSFCTPDFVSHYEGLLEAARRPAVCVIEHIGFADLARVNARHGIPTISCLQNVDAFDVVAPLRPEDEDLSYLAGIDFANEIKLLAGCRERLFISKVETSLFTGLGLASHYYPYRPVGAIRQGLERIRQARSQSTPEGGLLVMIGSAGHPTTRASFEWFVENAARHGLPANVRVAVAGIGTDRLLPVGVSVPGLELKGWLEQEELERLLVRAQGALVVQTCGFGAVTRLAELSCAGIPTLVSRHPTYADDLPPGAQVAGDDWPAWCAGMEQLASHEGDLCPADYDSWDSGQPNALVATVKQILAEQWSA